MESVEVGKDGVSLNEEHALPFRASINDDILISLEQIGPYLHEHREAIAKELTRWAQFGWTQEPGITFRTVDELGCRLRDALDEFHEVVDLPLDDDKGVFLDDGNGNLRQCLDDTVATLRGLRQRLDACIKPAERLLGYPE